MMEPKIEMPTTGEDGRPQTFRIDVLVQQRTSLLEHVMQVRIPHMPYKAEDALECDADGMFGAQIMRLLTRHSDADLLCF